MFSNKKFWGELVTLAFLHELQYKLYGSTTYWHNSVN